MIEQLLARYSHGRSAYNALYLAKFETLNKTQAPIAAMISCSDTRLEPSHLFALDPGEVFSIRNVANLVPDCSTLDGPCETAAGMEFAVTRLQVPHLVVLGHSHCIGIRTLMNLPDSDSDDNFTDQWLRPVSLACRVLEQGDLADDAEAESRACEQESIRLSLHRLMSYPWIRDRVESDRLKLHGWYYNLGEGQLFCLDPDTGCFARAPEAHT